MALTNSYPLTISECTYPDREFRDVLTWFGGLVPPMDKGGGIVPVRSRRCCRHGNCPSIGKGRHRWVDERLDAVAEDFRAREIYAVRFPNEKGWGAYRAQMNRLRKKQEGLVYPVRFEGGGNRADVEGWARRTRRTIR